jgi:hypothetical protein
MQTLTVGYVFNSAAGTLLTNAPMPFSWTTLRVVTLESGRIEMYADSTLIYSTTTSMLAGEKNAGIWNSRNGQGLVNRWDNFTILDSSPQ